MADNHPLKAGNATSAYLAQQRAIENFYNGDWYQSQMAKKRKAAQKERAVQQALNQGDIDRQVWEDMPSFSEAATGNLLSPLAEALVGGGAATAIGASASNMLGNDATLGEYINPKRILSRSKGIGKNWALEDVKNARKLTRGIGAGAAGAAGAYGLNKLADAAAASGERDFNKATADEAYNWANELQGIPIDTIGTVQPKRAARIPILIEED